MATNRQVDFETFIADHPVFTLSQLAEARGSIKGLKRARNQLVHHVRSGRVQNVTRQVYAAVPPGIKSEAFFPDPYLVAAAARPDGIFAYHSALELLGQAHSIWNQITLHCGQRRTPLHVSGVEILFLATPTAMRSANLERLGTKTVLRGEARLVTTGPERTLVEGLRQPHRCGGLNEHVESIAGLPLLDFDLLQAILEAYGERGLWAATGWLVEREVDRWHPPAEFLALCGKNRPRQMQYLLRNQRGGTAVSPWNLIVPTHLARGFEGHASNT